MPMSFLYNHCLYIDINQSTTLWEAHSQSGKMCKYVIPLSCYVRSKVSKGNCAMKNLISIPFDTTIIKYEMWQDQESIRSSTTPDPGYHMGK